MPGKKIKKIPGFLHPDPGENCWYVLQKTRVFTPGKYLSNTVGMGHPPALPLAGIYFFQPSPCSSELD
jgi:hypothetical protein